MNYNKLNLISSIALLIVAAACYAKGNIAGGSVIACAAVIQAFVYYVNKPF
jgi:hypothetical protein